MTKLNKEIIEEMERIEKLNKAKEAITIKTYFPDQLNFELYDFVNELSGNEIEGHCYKRFCRCNSAPIKHLKNDQYGYVTYVDDVLAEGKLLEKISVLIKQMPNRLAIKETLASQILNYFDAPTPFNFYVEDNMVVSVDFISKGERFESCDNLGLELSWRISDSLDNIDEKFAQYDKEQVGKIKSDFIKTTLVRKYLLGDYDFYNQNMGILKDKFGNIKFIGFDYERAIQEIYISQKDEIELDYIRYYYPEEYKYFVENLPYLKSAVETTTKIENPTTFDYLKTIGGNAEKILSYHASLSEDEKNIVCTYK